MHYNQILRDQQKYEFSYLMFKSWVHTKQPDLRVDMFVMSYSTLIKKMELCIATWTW